MSFEFAEKDENTPEEERSAAAVSVVMFGQRRTGKSSVLAMMLDEMNRICWETNFKFTADKNTQLLMNTKKSNLEQIFHIYNKDEVFSTLMGEDGGKSYSEPTKNTISYFFKLGLDRRRREADEGKSYNVEFVDIRGEDVVEDQRKVSKRLAQSSVIVIAIDSVALMEESVNGEPGKFHQNVNNSSYIIDTRIRHADVLLAEARKEGEKLPPKLVLFVPIKCEKYYYEKRMNELNNMVKKGYSALFAYFRENDHYTVAITPIMTLGDVVFEKYTTMTRDDGKEVVETFHGTNAPSKDFIGIPKSPMFRFVNPDGAPEFSPKYCEQPLFYLLAYIVAINNLLTERRRKCFTARVIDWLINDFSISDIFSSIKKFTSLILGICEDTEMIEAAQEVIKKLKTEGDGYEIVYDRLGIKRAKQQ